jgi:hypothetical protein
MASYDPVHRTASPYDQHGNYDNYGQSQPGFQQGGYTDQGGYGNYGQQQQPYADNPNNLSAAPRDAGYGGASSPYGSGDGYYNESSGFVASQPKKKKKTSPWIKFGIPLLILIIAGVVVGVVLGIRHHDSSAAATASGSAAAASSAAAAIGLFAQQTNSLYMMPIYPQTVRFSTHLSVPSVS